MMHKGGKVRGHLVGREQQWFEEVGLRLEGGTARCDSYHLLSNHKAAMMPLKPVR